MSRARPSSSASEGPLAKETLTRGLVIGADKDKRARRGRKLPPDIAEENEHGGTTLRTRGERAEAGDAGDGGEPLRRGLVPGLVRPHQGAGDGKPGRDGAGLSARPRPGLG